MSPEGDFIQWDCRKCHKPMFAREFLGNEYGCNQCDWSQARHNMIHVHCPPWNQAMHTNVSSEVEMFRRFIDFVAVAESVRSSSIEAAIKKSDCEPG